MSSNYFDPDLIRDGEREYKRLKKKVKEYVKKNIRDYITEESFIGRRGKKLVQIPITGIKLPHFQRDRKKTGGVGQGEGDEGEPLPGQQPQQGKPKAGEGHVEHAEAEVSVEEVLDVLQEVLELPNIQEKGKKKIVSKDIEYTDLRKTGPESLLDIKRTLKNSFIRILCAGEADCSDVTIEKDDFIFKSWREVIEENAKAVVIIMMDISGSMREEQKKLVKTTSFWLEQWLKRQYKGQVEIVFLVHDEEAWEVTSEQFYSITADGGTKISSVLALCNSLIDSRYPASDWNIYPFFFSDGDNIEKDCSVVVDMLLNNLIPKSNQVCYGQVSSESGSTDMYKYLLENMGDCEKLCVYKIKQAEDIIGAIKKFLSRGR